MSKKHIPILLLAVAMYVGLAIWLTTARIESENERDLALQRAEIVMGDRDNAENLACQYKEMYQAAVQEIAALEAENEELTRAFEETSFALGEVVYETGWTQLGTFKLTFYCPCERCCGKWAGGLTAGGTVPTEGRTVAVDTGVIPLGTRLRIGGHEYIAEDTGVSGRTIDVFVDNHNEALQLGVQYSEVEREA